MRRQAIQPPLHFPRRRVALAIWELLVLNGALLLVACLLVSCLLTPMASRARFQRLRAQCSNNLRSIAQACQAYANDATKHVGTIEDVLPSAGDDTAASLWLVIDHQFIGREYFLCPEAELRRDLVVPAEGDTAFSARTCSYSYLAQAYPEGGAIRYASIPWKLYAGMIILADDNPQLTFDLADTAQADDKANSENHDGAGQNVADITGSVRWVRSPKVPVREEGGSAVYDNIYTGAGANKKTRRSLTEVYLIP